MSLHDWFASGAAENVNQKMTLTLPVLLTLIDGQPGRGNSNFCEGSGCVARST